MVKFVFSHSKLRKLPFFADIFKIQGGLCCPFDAHDLKCKRRRWDFCEESTVWHFLTKCAAVKFAKPWTSNHLSKTKDPATYGSAICLEYPTKDWRGKSCWLDPRESDPEVVQRPGEVTTSLTCLVPSWRGSCRFIWNCCWPWGILSPRVVARDPP